MKLQNMMPCWDSTTDGLKSVGESLAQPPKVDLLMFGRIEAMAQAWVCFEGDLPSLHLPSTKISHFGSNFLLGSIVISGRETYQCWGPCSKACEWDKLTHRFWTSRRSARKKPPLEVHRGLFSGLPLGSVCQSQKKASCGI